MTPASTHAPTGVPTHTARQRRVVLGLFVTASAMVGGAALAIVLLLLNGG